MMNQPLELVNLLDNFDILVNVKVVEKQVRQERFDWVLLVRFFNTIKPSFFSQEAGMLTRDARKVERKKYGQ